MQGQIATTNQQTGDDEHIDEPIGVAPDAMSNVAATDAEEVLADDDQAFSAEEELPGAVVTMHPRADRNQHLRIVEAVLFCLS